MRNKFYNSILQTSRLFLYLLKFQVRPLKSLQANPIPDKILTGKKVTTMNVMIPTATNNFVMD